MIWGMWLDPNFEFYALDAEGKDYQHFGYAEDEPELRRQLEGMNLRVEWVRDYDFGEWKDRARAATEKAFRAYQEGKRPIKFDSKIWAELKWHIFGLFFNKCAYCECKVLPGAFGDVEHYRPKGKVDEDEEHPGYYWLAYDITNLLPSCEPCNRARAKMNHFPVEGRHARAPQELAAEQPLLLNPYDRTVNPFEHLKFGAAGEVLTNRGSSKGENSRIFYHLNRPNLSEARRTALAQVEQDWNIATIRLSFERAYDEVYKDLTMGHREYSAAQLWQLDRIVERKKVFLQGVRPLGATRDGIISPAP